MNLIFFAAQCFLLIFLLQVIFILFLTTRINLNLFLQVILFIALITLHCEHALNLKRRP